MEHKIWYSVENCGDGSAYPKFMESEALCEIDQKFMYEGWGEPCVGSLVIVTEGPITVKELVTLDAAIKEVEDELNEDYMHEWRKAGKYTDTLSQLDNKLAALRELKE